VKSNRNCSGYLQHPIFVSYQTPGLKRLNEGVEKTPTKRLQPQDVLCQRKESGLAKKRQKSPASDLSGQILEPDVAPIQLSDQISSKPAYRQQILHVYLDQIVPKADLGLLRERMWIKTVPTLPYVTKALEVAIMAMCFAKIGDFQGDETFKFGGLQLYHRALRELQFALLDPHLLYDDQTLGACVALTHYELTQCPSDSMVPYTNHIVGCAKLVQIRGPERHRDGLAHKIFAHFRVQAVSLFTFECGRRDFAADLFRYYSALISKPRHSWQSHGGGRFPGNIHQNRHMTPFGICSVLPQNY